MTIAVLFLALSVGICILSISLPLALAPNFWVGAGAFPFILGTVLVILSVWWLLDLLLAVKREKNKPQTAEKKRWLDELFGNRQQKQHLIVIMVSTLVFVFGLIPIFGKLSRDYGFVIASFLFLCVTIKIFTDIKIGKVILISAATVVIIYLVFHYGLNLMMPV